MMEELQEQLEHIEEIRKRGLISTEFKAWHGMCLSVIEKFFGVDSSYAQRFRGITYSLPPENTRIPDGYRKKLFQMA